MGFCGNDCTAQNQLTTCQLLQGTPGMGGCIWQLLLPDGGAGASKCGILAGTTACTASSLCPDGFLPFTIQDPSGNAACACLPR
jgi:hypothetical protein